MRMPLSADSLPQLSDGYLGKMVDQALATVNRDLDERGHDGQKRKIMIELTFEADGPSVTIDTQVKTSLPAQRPPVTMAKYDRAAGGLIFNPDVPNNPDQGSFADLKGEIEA